MVQRVGGQSVGAVPSGDASIGKRQLELLSDLSARLLNSDADPDALHGLFVRLREELNVLAEFGFVARLGESTQLSIATGELPEACLAPLQSMATDRKEVYIRDVQRTADPNYEYIRSRGYRAFASQPISTGDDLRGVLCFGTNEQDDFAPDDLNFFRTIARHIALAIERTSNKRALEESSRELQHRVNNMLSMVQAVAMLSRNRAHDVSSYQKNFDGRLLSLARTHNLLTNRDHRADLHDILGAEVESFNFSDRLTMHGPRVVLPAMIATSVGLVIHELTANAVKFGALSADGGSISIIWSAREETGGQRVLIHWLEEGGPSVGEPLQRGFGEKLLDQSLGSDLKVQREFLPGGVRATIAVVIQA